MQISSGAVMMLTNIANRCCSAASSLASSGGWSSRPYSKANTPIGACNMSFLARSCQADIFARGLHRHRHAPEVRGPRGPLILETIRALPAEWGLPIREVCSRWSSFGRSSKLSLFSPQRRRWRQRRTLLLFVHHNLGKPYGRIHSPLNPPAILIMATVNRFMLSQLSKLARLEAEMSRNIDFYALLALDSLRVRHLYS